MPVLIPEALTLVSLAALILAFAGLLAAVLAWRRMGRLEDHYRALMTGVDGRDLASAQASYVARLVEAEGRVAQLAGQAEELDRRLRKAVRRVCLLRYRAFEDAGGDQSFALALLDDEADGAVLSGLYGRGGVRVYAKPVSSGRSTYALTAEEQRVIDEAVSGPHEVDRPTRRPL